MVEIEPGESYRDEVVPCERCDGRGGFVDVSGGGFHTRICPACDGTGQMKKERSKGEARAAAIKKFQEAAQKTTLPLIQCAVAQLLSLVIQYKGVGGSLAGATADLANQLREAADFMEDV